MIVCLLKPQTIWSSRYMIAKLISLSATAVLMFFNYSTSFTSILNLILYLKQTSASSTRTFLWCWEYQRQTFNRFINSTRTSLLKKRTLFSIKVRRKLLLRERERDLYLLITLQSSKFTCCPLQIGLIVRCTTRCFGWRLLGFLPAERAEGRLGPRTHPPSRLLTSRSRGWTDKTGTHRVQNMIGANTSLASVENLANYLYNFMQAELDSRKCCNKVQKKSTDITGVSKCQDESRVQSESRQEKKVFLHWGHTLLTRISLPLTTSGKKVKLQEPSSRQKHAISSK